VNCDARPGSSAWASGIPGPERGKKKKGGTVESEHRLHVFLTIEPNQGVVPVPSQAILTFQTSSRPLSSVSMHAGGNLKLQQPAPDTCPTS